MCTKFCKSCGEYKDSSEFWNDKHTPDGKYSKCKECAKNKTPKSFSEPIGETKVCVICKEEKDLAYFYRRSDRHYKYQPKCIACSNKGLKIDRETFKDGKRKCARCQEYKNIEEFVISKKLTQGVACYCKICERINKKIHRDSLPADVKRKIKRLEYEKNREGYLRRSKEWYLNNKERAREVKRNSELNYKHTDPLKYFSRNISSVIRMSFNRKSSTGWKKEKRSEEILGCDMQDFRSYIESQFLNWMSWDNMGNKCNPLEYNCSWDLDHIIPVSYATTEEELYKLNHWSNYQPLCSKVNRYEKRDNIPSVCNIELKITT